MTVAIGRKAPFLGGMDIRIVFSALVMALASLSAHAQTEQTFEYNGVERTYYLDLPADLATGAPLVFVLHGYTSSAWVIRNYSDWSTISANEGVAVCYPQGTLDNTGTSHWNANMGISATDDHGFLVALAQHLQETYSLSPDCTYSCGMSNGGFMSYSLACNHPDVFRAVGSVTGAMSQYDFNNCNPDEVVPVIHLHGTADLVVSYDNGVGAGTWGNAGVPEIMDLWTGLMGTTEVYETDLPNLELVDLSSVEFFRHYGAPDGQEFHHYRVSGGGHDWFGVWGNQDIQSTELLWDFFQSHCAGEFTSVEEEPQPEVELVQWTGDGLRVMEPCSVRAYDVQGRLVGEWNNVQTGTVIPRSAFRGAQLLQAVDPSGRPQTIRVQ